MDTYFEKFEDRAPPEPVPYSLRRELLWQLFATINLTLGGWYIIWRWGWSLNTEALWFAIPVALAETAAYIGMILFSINLWKTQDPEIKPPPEFINECDPKALQQPISVDVFFPTFDEEPELVKLSLLDAQAIKYPHNIDIRIHVLDDGKRSTMQAVADELGVNYITRENNIGFKAGNMHNGIEQTSGDFIVICDADTRPFPTILEHTLGYFRDPDVAWVQTPQWFFDIPDGKRLPDILKRYLWWPGYATGYVIEKLIGPVELGKDPFVSDPQMFYDVIQRRRNWAYGSFCCGAGSIHRRDSVMEVALRNYAISVSADHDRFTKDVADPELKHQLGQEVKKQAAIEIDMPPYKYHVSEDLYTSIELHSDTGHQWKSVMHPQVESKMLSPQDLQSWMVQRFKYAGGTLDIAIHDNPLGKKGMTFPRKLFYASTFWSNFGGVWNSVFLIAPIVYLFTGIAPIKAYSLEFFVHFLPYLICSELALMLGTWGVAGFKGKASYLAFFPVNLRALWTVIKGEKIKFPATPKSRQDGNFFHLVWPQFALIVLTAVGILYATGQYYIHQNPQQFNGLITNTFWGINNIIALSSLVFAAFWKPSAD